MGDFLFLRCFLLCAVALLCGVAASPTAPLGVHLAFAGPTGMRVSWMTDNNTDVSAVRFGTSSGVYTNNATGDSSRYYKTWQHHVKISSLKPDTKYFYQCGDGQSSWSQEYSFQSQPALDSAPGFTVAVYGDMGIKYSANTTKQVMNSLSELQWIYHIGDYAYADDRKEVDFESTWDSWLQEVEPIASAKAYMTMPGNHEASCHSYGSFFCKKQFDNFTAYRYRFRMPYQESQSTSKMWYSFNYKNVHFVSIDTETDYPSSPEGPGTFWNAGPFGNQLAWLEADLQAAAANRKNQPWIIVSGHRPMYSSAAFDFPLDQKKKTREAFEGLLQKYNVDVYLSGHVHAYERMYPIYNGVVGQKNYVNPKVPVHVVIGCAGNMEDHEKHWVSPTPDFLAMRNDQDFGFAKLNVVNDTVLEWTFLRGSDGSVADQFTLIKDTH